MRKALAVLAIVCVFGFVIAQNHERFVSAITSIEDVVDEYRARESELVAQVTDAEGARDQAQSALDDAQTAAQAAQASLDNAQGEVDAAQAALTEHQETEGQAALERVLAIAQSALNGGGDDTDDTGGDDAGGDTDGDDDAGGDTDSA